MPPGPPETPGDTAETSDEDHETTDEPVPHSSTSHWERRPKYKVPPPEPDDTSVTRRRVVAKRHLRVSKAHMIWVGGGNIAFQKAVQWLRTELEFGT